MHRDGAPQTILMSFVVVPDGRRTLDEKAIPPLMESITAIGLRTPITVRENEAGDYILIAGHHRYEACKRLGYEHIDAHCVEWDDREARLWEISENLHRAELSAIERAEQIDEWRRLTLEKVAHDVTPSQGNGQAKDRGVRKAAESLGVSHETVRRAETIAALPQDVRDTAREEGWSQKKLLDIAKPAKPPKVASDPLNGPMALEKQVARLMDAWNAAAPEAREEFLGRIDQPVMDARFG